MLRYRAMIPPVVERELVGRLSLDLQIYQLAKQIAFSQLTRVQL